MKSILATFFLLSIGWLQAQKISDYNYVIVPQKFNDFVKDDYQLNLLLKTILRKKNYEIIAEESTTFPEEVKNNHCLATTVDIQKIKSSFQNKLKVVFKDCNSNSLGEYFGNSKIKDFEKGYQDALNDALKSLVVSKPFSNQLPTKNESKKTDLLNTPATVNLNNNESNSKIESTDIYYLNGQVYELKKMEKNYVLLDKATQKTVIQFFPTVKENVYHALIESYKRNYQSIAFFSEDKIEVEYQVDQNLWELKTFTK